MTRRFFMAANLLFIALYAQAQQDTIKGNSFDEVIVTANKFPQKQRTTGKVITVISRQQIEQSVGRTVPQLLNDVAGITINGALSNIGTNPTVYMRGAQAGRTLILIDGVPVSDPSFIQNDFDLNLLSLNNVERIEIARGAQSTLYGSDAVAGVINFITVKKGDDKPLHVQSTLSGGNYGLFRGQLQLNGTAGKVQYQAGYARLSSRGFSAAYDSTGTKNFDNDGFAGNMVNASVSVVPAAGWIVRGFGRYTRYRTDVDFGSFADDKDFINRNSVLMGGGSFQYQSANVTVTGQYQYTENNRFYLDDSTDTNPAAFSNFAQDEYFAKSQFAEMYSTIQFSPALSLLTGADYRYSSMNNQYLSPSYAAAFSDTMVSQSSAYASLFFQDKASHLNIELGGRLNVHSQYGSNQTFTFNPSYTINNRLRVFGSVATGFKAPTLYQLYGGYVGNRNLKPEKSRTYELGVQAQTNAMTSRLVFFHRNIRNGIDFDNALTYQYFNFGEQRVSGFELEEKVTPMKDLSLVVNYTFLSPAELTQSRLTTKDTTYGYLLKRPQHVLNIMAAYTIGRFQVNLTGKYVSKRYDAVYGMPDVVLNSYFVVGGYAAYRHNDHLKVFVSGENIANTRFFEVRGFNAIPAMVNGGIVFNW